ncbi:LacI family transcriptional regulator [Allocoprobacillus halotolerans]|uniref:LacI family transcriptional regulator n=1 Tax=Allocoprobacillus halotolerans TaxID=2944914 RepID=A0ABY5I4W3_9FIRM|nr:LacI family DNA-binding transcriptional regulator [Allocoprobacillus halotolerans]UTY39088.1 LacI family transcriptional regulator [Allocoprobacillus halotolerans]
MATIKDVAKYAGVSISTVSIILNGKAQDRKISLDTQEKVANAIKSLNYQPNLSAKKLRSSSERKTIALFWTTDFREVMLARFLNGLHKQINKLGLNFDIVIYTYQNDELYKETELQGSSSFHGAIIANASTKDLQFLKSFIPLIPIVLYNREADNYSSVIVNDKKIGEIAANLCLQFQQIALVKAPYVFNGMKIRDNAFIAHVSSNIKIYNVNDQNIADGFQIAKDIDFKNIDVLFVPSNNIAYGIMHYCYLNNISIPDDLSLICVGNGLPEYDNYSNPALTVIEVPMENMAALCLEILTQLFYNSNVVKKVIEPNLIIRNSFKMLMED